MCPLSVDGRNRKSTFDTETKMRQSISFGLAGISSDHNIYCDRDQRLFYACDSGPGHIGGFSNP